jgi:hypothetical protein
MAAVTPYRLGFAMLGLIGSLIVAGAVLGLAAAICDIQRAMREMTDGHRRDLRVPEAAYTKARTEPRLAP